MRETRETHDDVRQQGGLSVVYYEYSMYLVTRVIVYLSCCRADAYRVCGGNITSRQSRRRKRDH